MSRFSLCRSVFFMAFMVNAVGLSAQVAAPPQVAQPAQAAQATQSAQVAQPAQAVPVVAAPTDSKIFSLDLGMVGGYGVKANSPFVGRSFGINFTVADSLVLGFANISTAHIYNLARLGYSLSPALAINVYVGNDDNPAGATAGGIGASLNILKSKSETGFSTALKLRIEYLFDTTAGIAGGDLLVAVCTAIGL